MDRKAFFESIRKASPSANLNRENGQFGPETLAKRLNKLLMRC